MRVTVMYGQTAPSAWIFFDRIVHAADYNGDGWTDILLKAGGSSQENYLYLHLHSGNPNAPYSTHRQLISDYGYSSATYTHTRTVQFMGDMDGNGLPDLMVARTTFQPRGASNAIGAPQPRPVQIKYARRSGNGVVFDHAGAHQMLGTLANETEVFFYYAMDLNGDGLSDWLLWKTTGMFYKLNRGNRQYTGWESLGDVDIGGSRVNWYENAREQIAYPYTTPKFAQAIQQVDLGADGRAELMFPGQRLRTNCVRLRDAGTLRAFCGDQLYGNFQVNGIGTGTPIYQSIDSVKYDRSLYRFNAIQFVEGADGKYTAIGVNTDFIGSAYQSAAVDAYGNGLTDLVFIHGCPEYSEDWCYYRNRYAGVDEGVHITRNRGSVGGGNGRYEPADMLSAVENAYGHRDEWHYRPLSSRDDRYHTSAKPFYEPDRAYLEGMTAANRNAHFHFTSSLYVVAEYRRSNGVGGLNKHRYRYKGAMYNRQGRGFQGFRTLIEADLANRVETQTDFHQIFPLAGRMHRTQRWVFGDRHSDSDPHAGFEDLTYRWLLRQRGGSDVIEDNPNNGIGVNAGPGDYFFVAQQQQTSIHRTLATRSERYRTQQTSSYDTWGNVVSATSHYSEGDQHQVTRATTTTYSPADTSDWWLKPPGQSDHHHPPHRPAQRGARG